MINGAYNNKARINLFFIAIALIIGGSFYFLFSGGFKSYRTESHVLILAKNELAANQISEISKNLVEISNKKNFYEKVLYDLLKSEEIERLEQVYTGGQFEKVAEAKNLGGSMMRIRTYGENEDISKKIASQYLKTLDTVIGEIYGAGNGVSMVIIGGQSVKISPIGFAWKAGIMSILLGFAGAFLIQIFVGWFDKRVLFRRKKNNLNKRFVIRKPKRNILIPAFKFDFPEDNNEKDIVKPKNITPERKGDIEFDLNAIIKKSIPEKLTFSTKKAEPPKNLPIRREIFSIKKVGQEDKIGRDEEKKDLNMRENIGDTSAVSKELEPTEEVFKERLNELLKGNNF